MGDIPKACTRCGLLVETRKAIPICLDCRTTDRWFVKAVGA